MGYIRKRWWCEHGCQVMEYHSGRRYPPGERRNGKEKPTPESVQKANARRKAMQVQRLILNNFDEGDKWITLTYSKEKEPGSMEECLRDISKLNRHIRRIYGKTETPYKWIRNVEMTKRGICHIHLLVNAVPGMDIGREIRTWWKDRYGRIARIQDTYLDGAFANLAAYLSKTQRDEDGKCTSKFSRSRNLVDPKPDVKEYVRWNARAKGEWREIRVPKGYELVRESVYEGVNEITGFPYRYYTLVRKGG